MSGCYRFVVRGRVQGVGFRQATLREAMRLGLCGWVANRADGAVEGEVLHNDAEAIARFRTWLEQGPPAADVAALEWIEQPTAAASTGLTGFSIRR